MVFCFKSHPIPLYMIPSLTCSEVNYTYTLHGRFPRCFSPVEEEVWTLRCLGWGVRRSRRAWRKRFRLPRQGSSPWRSGGRCRPGDGDDNQGGWWLWWWWCHYDPRDREYLVAAGIIFTSNAISCYVICIISVKKMMTMTKTFLCWASFSACFSSSISRIVFGGSASGSWWGRYWRILFESCFCILLKIQICISMMTWPYLCDETSSKAQ